MSTLLVLLLVLHAGNSDAWLFPFVDDPTTETPTVAAITGATTPPGTTSTNVTTNGTKTEEEDDDLSGVGEVILNVATGIREIVEAWDATTTAGTAVGGLTQRAESANANATGKAGLFGGRRGEEEGSGLGSGDVFGSDSGSPDVSRSDAKVLRGGGVPPGNLSLIKSGAVNETVEGALDPAPGPPCLPVPPDWPVCSGKGPKSFALPNFFNHTSVEEVRAVLEEWAWLTRKGCHPSAEWFLCLLLAPRCPAPDTPPPLLPCRRFCLVLQDSCWASLENGRLPVECHALPEGAPEPGRSACVSVSNWKGNPGGLECIRSGNTF